MASLFTAKENLHNINQVKNMAAPIAHKMSPTTNVLPQTHPMITPNPRKILIIVNLPIFCPCYPPKKTPFCSIMSMSFSGRAWLKNAKHLTT